MIADIILVIRSIYRLSKQIKEISDQVQVHSAQCRRLVGRVQRLEAGIRGLENKSEKELEHYQLGLEALNVCLEEAVEFIGTFGRQKKWYQRALHVKDNEARFRLLNANLSEASADLQLGLLGSAEMRSEDQADKKQDRDKLLEQKESILQLNREAISLRSEFEVQLLHKIDHIAQQRETSLLRQIEVWNAAMQRDSVVLSSPTASAKKPKEILHGIDYYELTFQNVLREGPIGQVYQGIWQDFPVAIKALGEGTVHFSGRDREQLLQEMLRMQTLNCPQLVRFYGGCIEDDHVCLVMEFMAGGNLQEYLVKNTEQMTLSHKKEIALNIAKGLAYLHQKRTLHRDLTSRHVMLTEEGFAKLVDFQSATSLDTQKSLQSLSAIPFSSLPWRAPECLLPSGKASPASDVYSFGIVLWELLTEQLPYEGYSDPALMAAVTTGSRPPISDSIPEDYAQLLSACWNQAPEKRPAISEVVNTLKTIATELTLYEEGESNEVAKKYEAAFRSYQYAAAAGHSKGWTKLADFAYQGLPPFEASNKVQAHEYYTLGASRGHVRAMYLLAEMLSFGDGIPKDVERAQQLYSKVSQMKDAPANLKDRAQRRLNRLSTTEAISIRSSLFRASEVKEDEGQRDSETLSPKSCCSIS